MRRTPRHYDGTALTGHHLQDLLTSVLRGIGRQIEEQPGALVAAWPQIVGPKLAPMAQAVAFVNGLLTVKVSDSTLYSLLVRHERQQLLKQLRLRFPKTTIKNIVFRVG